MRKRSFTFALATLFLLVASFASAATFVVPTDRILVQKADAIVVGTVLDSHAEVLPEGGVVTYTDISVQEVIKGRISTRSLRLVSPGGKVGDRITMIPGAPHFTPGRQSLFFLNGSEERGWGTTDLVVGKFNFASDINNNRVLVREESEIVGWDMRGAPFEDVRRQADRFLHFVRESTAGRMAPADYMLPKTTLRMSAEDLRIAADAVGTPLTYSMTEGGGSNTTPGFRWASFGANGLNWAAQNQASANPTAGQNAIINGMASWTNDCPSNVRYNFTGVDATATGKLNSPDGKNAVHFDVNLNTAFYGNIGPFTCGAGGVIALGGITGATSSHLHPVSGETFYSIVEGDVDVNLGVGSCNSFLSSEGWNTGMTHELGHTLGFRHSNTDRVGGACPGTFDCSNSAIMFSTILGGFNGALQTYDLNAVRIVYPGNSCFKPRGDFNGDGKSDIFWRDPTNGSNATWLMNGFVANGAGTTNIEPAYGVAGTGDFDGDGKADIVWRNQVTGANYIWLMNGHHASNGSPFTSVAPPWVISGVGDVDGDGKADIVWHNPANGASTIWLMNGFAVTNGSGIATVPDTNFNIVGVNDFSGDGKADLLWRNSVTGQNHIWLLNGLTVQATSSIPSVADLNFFVAGTGDFNGDARADILWRNDVNGQMFVWLIDGFATNGAPLPNIGDNNWRPRAVGDWDGDGKADIMLRNISNGANYLWFINGFNVVNGGPIPTVPALTWNPQVPK